MTTYEIVPATLTHAEELSRTMREADAREAWAAGRLSPAEAVLTSIDASRDARAGLANGRVACIFGVGEWSVLGLLGVPWLLTSDEMPKHARRFLRGSREYLDEIRQQYRVLRNHVDARNTEAVRWLGWLGFEIDSPESFGPDQLPFHCFHWEDD